MKLALAAAIGASALSLLAPVSNASGISFSEVRFGVLAHDPGLFGDAKEEGVDLNAEVYFEDLDWLGGAWEVRPSVGASVNLSGDTSEIMEGLT